MWVGELEATGASNSCQETRFNRYLSACCFCDAVGGSSGLLFANGITGTQHINDTPDLFCTPRGVVTRLP